MSTSPEQDMDTEDILFSQLTEGEIAELNDMIDPDVSLTSVHLFNYSDLSVVTIAVQNNIVH